MSWEEIKRCVDALAECDLSVPKAAVKLEMGTATMYKRCDTIEAQTGYDPRKFWHCWLLIQKANMHVSNERKKAGLLRRKK